MRRIDEIPRYTKMVWATQNPDVQAEHIGDFIRSNWVRVSKDFSDAGKMLVLLRNKQEIGGVLPAEMLYGFLYKHPHKRKYYPVAHIPTRDFAAHLKHYVDLLGQGQNLVLTARNKPKFAIVSTYFFSHLKVAADGHVNFFPSDSDIIYSNRFLTQGDIVRLEEIERNLAERSGLGWAFYVSLTGQTEKPIAPADKVKLQKVFEVLSQAPLTHSGYTNAIRGITLD